tara:strand:- start:177 stop:359 length:183 start_codon:yes stop_codon:yes gene_type:complete
MAAENDTGKQAGQANDAKSTDISPPRFAKVVPLGGLCFDFAHEKHDFHGCHGCGNGWLRR